MTNSTANLENVKISNSLEFVLLPQGDQIEFFHNGKSVGLLEKVSEDEWYVLSFDYAGDMPAGLEYADGAYFLSGSVEDCKKAISLYLTGTDDGDDLALMEEQVALAEKKAADAIAEASKYRTLWECAASCLSSNSKFIKPRGGDERKLLSIADSANHGVFWSGTTDGWL